MAATMQKNVRTRSLMLLSDLWSADQETTAELGV